MSVGLFQASDGEQDATEMGAIRWAEGGEGECEGWCQALGLGSWKVGPLLLERKTAQARTGLGTLHA